MSWMPTRAAGLARLEAFAPRAGHDYRNQRNYDRGPDRHVAVSGLSPYLRTRLISEPEVLDCVVAANSASAAEKFICEVFWRGYWKGWLEHHPDAWNRYQDELEQTLGLVAGDDALALRIAAATDGETGIDAFDSWVHELRNTGYLHNHARMWFASIWIFTLKLPWVLGADFFLRHLLDGDQASNTLSWRWVAGLHTRGKTYLARPDNIRRYTETRFHELHTLATDADALEDQPFKRHPLDLPPALAAGAGACGVLLSDEDVTLPPADNVTRIAGLISASNRSPLEVSNRVTEFARGALEDALQRGANQWAIPDGSVFAADQLDALVRWADAANLKRLVVSHLPVGPARTLIDALSNRLPDSIRLEPYVREYDRQVWPHATRGFFQLKKHIPAILSEITD